MEKTVYIQMQLTNFSMEQTARTHCLSMGDKINLITGIWKSHTMISVPFTPVSTTRVNSLLG
jgi:hypothetical protein